MHKLKQAIAYLAGKLQTACYAARFFANIIFWEIPHGHHRVIHKDIRGRVRRADNETPLGGIERGGENPVEPIREQEAVSSTAPTHDEILGFWAGDPLDRFYDSGYEGSADTQGGSAKDLRDEPQIQQCLHSSGAWDLLEPRDRQAIILDKMREYQSKTEDYCVFSTRDVVELCDRHDIQWDLAFADLMVLKDRRSVKINVVFNEDHVGKFIGLFWGLR